MMGRVEELEAAVTFLIIYGEEQGGSQGREVTEVYNSVKFFEKEESNLYKDFYRLPKAFLNYPNSEVSIQMSYSMCNSL